MQQLMALNQLERQVVPCALVFNAPMPSAAWAACTPKVLQAQ